MKNSLENILLFFSDKIRNSIKNIHPDITLNIREIIIAKRLPLIIYLANEVFYISKYNYLVTKDLSSAYIISDEEFGNIFLNITDGSPYVYEETISKGYITLSTGERVGVCGNGFTKENNSVIFKEINYLSFRIARDIHVFPDKLLKYIFDGKNIYNTLVISPPCCGKTTTLRDIARKLSTLSIPLKVGIIDEREEICLDNLWHQAIIMKGVSKTSAFDLFIRTLSPNIIITDEIGDSKDASSILSSSKRGISVIASAHAEDVADIYTNPNLKSVVNIFETYIVLSKAPALSNVKKVIHKGEEVYCT